MTKPLFPFSYWSPVIDAYARKKYIALYLEQTMVQKDLAERHGTRIAI